MNIAEILKTAKTPQISFEIIPPLKGSGIQKIFDVIDRFIEFNPAFVDVTYHRQDYTYIESPEGRIEKRLHRKRPGTVGICAAIINRYNIAPVPHMICGGFTKEDTEDALIDLHFLGIQNILVLQGDKLAMDKCFIPEKDGHKYASELLQQVINMNHGKYLDPDLVAKEPTHFCVGVAGYPEKHFEAPNMETDLHYLKRKIDMGAEYVITQMFFNNKKYFEFVNKCREKGINVPIIPGIKPLTTKTQLTALPREFFIEVPDELTKEVLKAKDNNAVKEIGVEWCIQQCKELIEHGVPSLHFYTMGRANPIKKIVEVLL